MTREEYMNELKQRINHLNIEGKDEIINDFNNHFELGHQDGISDEDLIETLGPIDEILESFEVLKKVQSDEIMVDNHAQKKEFTDKITKIDISARHAKTTITESKDGRINVNLSSEGKFLERLSHVLSAYQEESVFLVKILPIFPYKSVGRYELIVEIPNNLEALSISSSSGDIEGKNLSIDKFKIQSASGEIDIEAIQSQSITIEVASSDMNLNQIVGDLEIKSVSGDVNIDDAKGKVFSYVNVSGDIDIEADYKDIKLRNVSGDIDAKFKLVKEMNIASTSGDINIKIDNKDDLQITSHSLSGECEVKLAGKEIHFEKNGSYQLGNSECKIKLNTVSGDIHLDME
jgi:DUF4097 and DUF4098 domain-containing protein YvlB